MAFTWTHMDTMALYNLKKHQELKSIHPTDRLDLQMSWLSGRDWKAAVDGANIANVNMHAQLVIGILVCLVSD